MLYEIFILSVCYLTASKGNPIDIEIDGFEDTWDYKITPQNEPILLESEKDHKLPAIFTNLQLIRKAGINENDININKTHTGDVVRRKLTCATCKLGALLLQSEVRKGTVLSELKEKFVSICVGFNIENEIVCTGIFDVFGPDVLPALNVTQIGPAQMCSLCLGEICGDVENPLHDWDVQLPDIPKPKPEKPTNYVEGAPTFKVLHLSDTHLDLNYEEGSPSNCEEPLCCHSYSTPEKDKPLIPAGKWGSYGKCDVPKVLIDNMFKHIGEEHKDIDYIIWTGDLPSHEIWNQTKEGNLEILKEAVRQMEEAFPNIPIFPALGNHEGVPAGSFPPPWIQDEEHSISWLYEELSRQWLKWLPSTINDTVDHGAFYSVLIRPGFRLISLNMNYCISVNWWLIINSTDPAKELQWLIYELQEAENNGEKVHIIGHVPPGDSDCIKIWSQNYYKVIDRYEDTVTAQFFSHTHSDEFEVFYDADELKKPTSIAYVGPSITTFEDFNPGYRIYYVDGDHNKSTWEVLDHETWVTNLEEANKKNSEPEWYRLYTAREAFSLETLRPEEWSKLIDRMAKNRNLFNLFYRFYYKDSPVRPACDDKCRLEILCDLKSGKSNSRHQLCKELEEIIKI